MSKKKVEANINEDFYNNAVWISARTLGGKAKAFEWIIDNSYSIHISRVFENGKKSISLISEAELNKIDEYMKVNEWVDLANNVEKLGNGSEKDGVGKFIYTNLEKDISIAQLASHLSAIFVLSGAWEHNGLKRKMQFKSNGLNWQKCVEEKYKKMK